MYKPESVLKNKMHKIQWDFEIPTDHLIPARKPGLDQLTIKKNCSSRELCHSSRPRSENKRNRKDKKWWDLARELKRLWNMRVMVMPIEVGSLGMVLKELERRLEQKSEEETRPFCQQCS